jgi:hypothetical protein
MPGRDPAPALQPSQLTPIAIIPPDQADATARYVPGACNIGPQEIRRRRAFGVAGIAAAAVLFAVLVATGAPAWMRLLVLLPLMGGVFSWLQARRRFCAGFAIAGLANFGDAADLQRDVQDADARRADLAAVRRMARDAFLVALPITLLAVLLPV